MSGPVEVRPGVAEDVPRITAFQCAMAQETEGKSLDSAVVERAVMSAMGDSGKGEYLVAVLDGQVVGSLMLTREWSDWRDAWWLWIQSVYTAPEARRRGVYRALYAAVRARAERASDVLGIRLYVEAENHPAQRVYAGLGMEALTYRFYEASLGRTAEPERPNET